MCHLWVYNKHISDCLCRELSRLYVSICESTIRIRIWTQQQREEGVLYLNEQGKDLYLSVSKFSVVLRATSTCTSTGYIGLTGKCRTIDNFPGKASGINMKKFNFSRFDSSQLDCKILIVSIGRFVAKWGAYRCYQWKESKVNFAMLCLNTQLVPSIDFRQNIITRLSWIQILWSLWKCFIHNFVWIPQLVPQR